MRRAVAAHRDDVSATQLAEMSFCEKRMLLVHLHGEAASAGQREAMKRGNAAHRRFYVEGGAAQISDRRCFVATCLFGEMAPQTRSLRAYRDAVLLAAPWGRGLVRVYYLAGPRMCALLERWPMLQRPLRSFLTRLAGRCDRMVQRRRRTLPCC